MVEVHRGIWVVAYQELLRFVQERSRIISALAFPLMFLVVLGTGAVTFVPVTQVLIDATGWRGAWI